MSFLLISQILICIAIIGLVLIQAKGTGLSSAFGGSIGFYRSRRGIEKGILILTIIFGLFLVINALLLSIL